VDGFNLAFFSSIAARRLASAVARLLATVGIIPARHCRMYSRLRRLFSSSLKGIQTPNRLSVFDQPETCEVG
jgi:hypothetical protein